MRKINTCASTVRQFVATFSINEFQCAKCRDELSRGRDNLSRKFARQFAATETPYCTLHGTTRASHQEFPKKKKAKKRNSLFVDRAFLTIRAARDHSASRRARKTNAHHAGGRPITSATVRFPLALYLGEPSRVAFDASRPHFCSRASSRCAGLTNHAPIGSTHRLSVLPPTWSPRRPRSTVLLVAFHLKR